MTPEELAERDDLWEEIERIEREQERRDLWMTDESTDT